MKKFIHISIIFMMSLSFELSAQTHYYSEIDSLINTCHDRGVFNGNALVIKNGAVIFSVEKGFTDGSKAKKLTKNSIFDIGSISKEFSAVGIMMLKEKGLLSLDDKISKFNLGLPDWAKNISISNLLQYSSGLPSVDWENVHSDADVYESIRALKNLKFKPGTGYLYSNNNNFLQKRIIEKITGIPFNTYLKENILTSIGLNNSVIDHQYQNPNFVRAFNSEDINDKKLELKMSGSVCPSIGDLAKWTQQLLSNKIISKNSFYQLFESYSKDSQSALGMGVFAEGELLKYEHHGSSLNYESIVHYDVKEKLLIVLMTNHKSLKIDEISHAISQIIKGETYEIPQKSVYLTIRETTYKNAEEGIAYYRSLKKNHLDTYNFSNQWELARLSYKLFEKNQNDAGLKILQLLTSELPNKSEEALEFLGARLLSENQINQALLIYQLMIAEFPSEKSYNGLGDVYYENKQYEEALVSYRKSLTFDLNNEHSKKKIAELEK